MRVLDWQTLKMLITNIHELIRLGEYFEILEKIGVQFNVATLTGHSTLRGGALKEWNSSSQEEQKKETFVNQAAILMQYYCRYTPDEIRERRLPLLHKLENRVCDKVGV